MTTFKPVIRKNSLRQDGSTNIKIRVSHQRKVSYLPTKYYVKPEEFDSATGKVKSIYMTEQEADVINLRLTGQIGQYAMKLEYLGGKISTMDIKSLMRILRDQYERYDIYSLIDEKIEMLKKVGNVNYSSLFERTKRMLQDYYGSHYLTFDRIDSQWLRRLEVKMRTDGLKSNTIGIYMRNIRTVYNQAITMGLIDLNMYPFRRYQIPKETTIKRNITADEMKKIRTASFENELTEWARDIFMLSFYLLGINMKDLMYLEGIEDGRIYYIRSKGKRQYSVLVQPEAFEIIEKYRGKKYLLNTMENYADYRSATKRINKKLKDVAKECKINKKITTYYARHSWATIANRIGISRDTIRYALGHAGGTVTDIYIDYDLEQVDEANRKVIDYITTLPG